MKVKKVEEIKSHNVAEVIFAAAVGGVCVGVGFGPLAGLVAAALGFSFGYPAAKRHEKSEAKRLIRDDGPDREMLDLLRQGNSSVTKKTRVTGVEPNQPILGKIVFGSYLEKETKYYLDD